MKVLRKALQLAAGNTVCALIATLFLQVFHENSGKDLWVHLKFSLVYSFCIGTLCWTVMDWGGRRLTCLRRGLRIPTVLGLLALLAFVGSLLANLLFVVFGWMGGGAFWSEFGQGLRISMLITIMLGTVSMVVEVLWARLQEVNAQLRDRQLEHERARQLVTQARLSQLESRIHPHFLFNTLNSISALIREDPRQAERMVERLAALLRYSLDHNARGLVPLRQELHVVEDYLEIERTRFGDRLRFTVNASADLDELEVPPFALQTLVENSIKHAVARNRHGGQIQIDTSMVAASLLVEVSDDGPGFDEQQLTPGHGLENLQERLTTLFDGEGRLEISRRGARTVVGVRIPQKKVLA